MMASELQGFSSAWADKMVEIWRDKIDLLDAIDTGRLRASVAKERFRVNDSGGEIGFRFIYYGVYVDAGVGNGYKRGNGGDLQFLGKTYRATHGLGEPRKKKRWFSPSWYISTRVIAERWGRILGERFAGLIDNLK